MFATPGAALIRAAAYPAGLDLPPLPNLAAGTPAQWQEWLRTVWAIPKFAEAVTSAAPQLAGQIDRGLTDSLPPRELRRLVESAVRYLLRWTTRPTPFGTFAGVAPITFGPHAAVRWGEAHRAVARPDDRLIDIHATRAEHDLAALRTTAVVTNTLGYRRGHRWVLPCAQSDGARRFDVEVRLTSGIQAAIEAASTPVPFAGLSARLAGSVMHDVDAAERLLASLVQTGVLLSGIRPATTVTDPAGHLARHVSLPDAGTQAAVDLRLDADVTLPPAVLHEAGRAASALTAVAPHFPGWADYHAAFIHRWGPGAAVPMREVLNVLGFPAGFRGASRRVPAVFTARDRALAQLAQQSAMTGGAEVILDDALINGLRGDDDRPPVPHTELRFTLAAPTLRDLDRGTFTLTVAGGSRHAGAAAGRFLHLLHTDELAAFAQVYRTLPPVLAGAQIAQLSGPPLDARMISVARAPELLPVLPVGDFHPDPVWTVADLAVTGDGDRLWLVSLTTGQPVEPLLLNSVLLPSLQQPLIRFLTEIWAAWTAPCTRFDWGHAESLPFLPRVRRGRSILHPARWAIARTDLPAAGETWSRWHDAWQRQRERLHLPDEVLVGDGDVQLRLDLQDSNHLAILRALIARRDHTTVTEAPGPAGWIDGRPAELLLTLTHASRPAPPTRAVRRASSTVHRPGRSSWLEARLYGNPDHILTDLAGRAEQFPDGWWFLRYPDPEPHLRLRIPTGSTSPIRILTWLAAWTQDLEHDAVLHNYSLHTYRPETRHGTGPAQAAAEAVFAADSRTILHRLHGDRQATTAAGMIAIADAFTGDGLHWIATHVPHRTGPRLTPQQLARARTRLYDAGLATALAAYRCAAEADGIDADQVLADLLHLHHARMIGVDIASERHCLRLARATARTHQMTS
ncbi:MULTISPECIES: lantibiotic dehydratase [Catenuloplanes]|uniref:Thiopeptide-type bacteriocin biosynthesis protein n=1 Tax=Catenuloplanes niger TaxID=587534 RepID=A0AAE4CQF5_9ACTN|nr:lantibiotic dehydratase [Catenuloplanes niger]MDR7320845.1 thiopeptide-type bacteriocin biosynthesis protein [Catenuloplanes niger]